MARHKKEKYKEDDQKEQNIVSDSSDHKLSDEAHQKDDMQTPNKKRRLSISTSSPLEVVVVSFFKEHPPRDYEEIMDFYNELGDEKKELYLMDCRKVSKQR